MISIQEPVLNEKNIYFCRLIAGENRLILKYKQRATFTTHIRTYRSKKKKIMKRHRHSIFSNSGSWSIDSTAICNNRYCFWEKRVLWVRERDSVRYKELYIKRTLKNEANMIRKRCMCCKKILLYASKKKKLYIYMMNIDIYDIFMENSCWQINYVLTILRSFHFL